MAPSAISHYRLEEALFESATGVFYRGHDERSGRAVTLVLLRLFSAIDDEVRKRISRELRAAASLNHPNVAQIYDFGEVDGQPFLVMEELKGTPLEKLLHGSPLPFEQIKDIGIQAANALFAVHSAGIVHRDINPRNMLVSDRGSVKILDLGLPSVAQIRSGVSVKPINLLPVSAYMSPEDVSGKPAGALADIYSLGAVLYEMATGRPPFVSAARTSTEELAAAILKGQSRPIRETNKNVPPALEAIILRAMGKKPEDRFQTMHELALKLEALEPNSVMKTNSRLVSRFRNGIFGVSLARNFGLATLISMLLLVPLALIRFKGTPLGFALAFGAMLLGYESYLLLRAASLQDREIDNKSAHRIAGTS